MGINKVNIFNDSRRLQSEVQTIAGEIADASISPKKYQHLFKKLNHALETLVELETQKKMTSLFAKAQVQHLREQMIKLYGDLENGLIKREVSQIKEKSISLKNGRLTLKAVKKLEMHISELEKNHLTSIPDRRIIADAKYALLEAKAKLDGKPIAKHIQWLAKQKSVQFTEETTLIPGEVEELFDIARAVYNRDLRQAKMRYHTVSEGHKQIFHKHMQNLLAKPFDDLLETIQALLATANELVENGESYPSSDQIDQLFLGLSQLYRT